MWTYRIIGWQVQAAILHNIHVSYRIKTDHTSIKCTVQWGYYTISIYW